MRLDASQCLQTSDAAAAASAASATATKTLTFVGMDEALSAFGETLDLTVCPICYDAFVFSNNERVVVVGDTTHLCEECYESARGAMRKGEDPLRGFYVEKKGATFTFCDRKAIVICDNKVNSGVVVQVIKCGCGEAFNTTVKSAMSAVEHARTCPVKFLQDIRNCSTLAESVSVYNKHSPPRVKRPVQRTEEQSPLSNVFSPTRLDAPLRPRRSELGPVSRFSFAATPFPIRFPGARSVVSGAVEFHPVPPPMLHSSVSGIAHGEEEEDEVTTDEEVVGEVSEDNAERATLPYLLQVPEFARRTERRRREDDDAPPSQRHTRRRTHAPSNMPPIPSPE